MKSLALALLFFLSISVISSAHGKDHGSSHHLADAKAQALELGKSMLLVFVGGEWHEPSQKFREEILKNVEFKKKIEEDFLIHVLEYSKKEEEIDETLKSLREKYRANRFPAILQTDADGRPFGYTGFRAGGAEALVKDLEQALELLGKRDEAFAEAEKATGVDRAKAIEKGLRLFPPSILREHYAAQLAAIKKADPKGETALLGELEKSESLERERNAYGQLFEAKGFDQVIQKSKKAASQAEGEDAQRLLMYGIQALVSQKKYDEANKAIDAMAKLAPESNFGRSASRYRQVVSGMKARANAKPLGAGAKPQLSARPAKPRGPIVSKPVAVVNNVKPLEDDLKALRVELAKINKKVSESAKQDQGVLAQLEEVEKSLASLKKRQADREAKLAPLKEEQERLTKKEKALSEVIENYHAMEKRKKDTKALEKEVAEDQKKAKAIREKQRESEGGQ